jgi:hypothetical protein
VIIQLRSRPGFSEFLSTIESLSLKGNFHFFIDDIPLWMYDAAQQIKQMIKPGSHRDKHSDETQTNSDENGWQRSLYISSEVIAACQPVKTSEDKSFLHLFTSNESFSLRIPREEYCILRLCKNLLPEIAIFR